MGNDRKPGSIGAILSKMKEETSIQLYTAQLQLIRKWAIESLKTNSTGPDSEMAAKLLVDVCVQLAKRGVVQD